MRRRGDAEFEQRRHKQQRAVRRTDRRKRPLHRLLIHLHLLHLLDQTRTILPTPLPFPPESPPHRPHQRPAHPRLPLAPPQKIIQALPRHPLPTPPRAPAPGAPPPPQRVRQPALVLLAVVLVFVSPVRWLCRAAAAATAAADSPSARSRALRAAPPALRRARREQARELRPRQPPAAGFRKHNASAATAVVAFAVVVISAGVSRIFLFRSFLSFGCLCLSVSLW